ncbi:ATP-binding protein [Nonomuraea sp. NPDC050783]|uniref:ATP-binding protein n=1 Tax=Nonomuraea sp. NPDC050783 TaxID=3154634 RepID=UPI0034669753
MIENPFRLPTDTPVWERDIPLCEWQAAAHTQLYVPIDNTEQAYQKFKEFFAFPGLDLTGGRLITIAGESGYGKTSLANRCAHWLTENRQRSPGVVKIDARGESPDDLLAVYRTAATKVHASLGVPLAEGAARAHDARAGYQDLSGRMLQDLVALVLLPPISSKRQLDEYEWLARHRGNFIFLTETATTEISRLCTTVYRDSAWHLRLELGEATKKDALMFIEARLASVSYSLDTILEPGREEIRDIIGNRHDLRSIRSLQCYLFDTFEHVKSQDRDRVLKSDFERTWNSNALYR